MRARHNNRIPRISIIRGELDYASTLNIEAWRALFQAKIIFHSGCSAEVAHWLTDFAKAAEIVDLGLGFDRMGPHQPYFHRTMATDIVFDAYLQGEVVLVEPEKSGVTTLITAFIMETADMMGVPVRIIPASLPSTSVPTDSRSNDRQDRGRF
ncbi:hypothetical protein [Roseiterribacter gracilis]|uniref:Uncharacterized protein n=1 Tax=Roseiterribacter gracilis TaxID=2812848 RepID=A0A8S8XIZ3_9PROT|nr:hypothetical protein TMPK1_38840 [Rhodospirillales bacterium TMPK1]